MQNAIKQKGNACLTLFDRAFRGETVVAFGEDGFGKYGKHDQWMQFTVKSVEVAIIEDNNNLQGYVEIILDGYDASVVGHILTDNNFRISIDKILNDFFIDPEALTWGDLHQQTNSSVVMRFDIDKILIW